MNFENLLLVKLKVFVNFLFAINLILFALACNQNKLHKKDDVFLRLDTVNVVKLHSTLIFAQVTCRGCATQYNPKFSIKDSLGLIELIKVNDSDENLNNEVGGNTDRSLELKAIKTGKSILYVYKSYLSNNTTSVRDVTYKVAIEVIK